MCCACLNVADGFDPKLAFLNDWKNRDDHARAFPIAAWEPKLNAMYRIDEAGALAAARAAGIEGHLFTGDRLDAFLQARGLWPAAGASKE